MQRYTLYRSSEEHSADCDKYPYEKIPARVFLDTNIVSCLVKWHEQIFEHQIPPLGIDPTLAEDIESLMHIFLVGSRAYWNILVSSKTLEELSKTSNLSLRSKLLEYGTQLVGYGTTGDSPEEDRRYCFDLARRLVDSPFLARLPDIPDRELISHAVALQCDVFCTRDRHSIHRKRNYLRHIPLRVLTPGEWWNHVKPWAGLWL
jgi:hypothetical protein